MEPLTVIARLHNDFPTKFGIPRQSGVVADLPATIVLEREFRNPDALRGLEDFSHLWLIWGFSQVKQKDWSPTVRPPRLGGNTRLGVFATRSPYRPNPLGLSAVRLGEIQQHPTLGPVLHVLGADLMDGTPIYDIKPYLPYADCHPDATGGFAGEAPAPVLEVVIPDRWLRQLPEDCAEQLRQVLALDPRPAYQQDPARVYGMPYAQWDVRFRVAGQVLTVVEIVPHRPDADPNP